MRSFALGLIAALVAIALRLALAPVIQEGYLYLLLYPAVAIVAWKGGLWPGLLTATLGAAGTVALLDPGVLRDPAAPVHGVVFLGSALLISALAESHLRARRVLARAATERGHTEQLLAASQQIAHVGSWVLEAEDGDLMRGELRWSDECFRVFGFEPGTVEATNELFFSRVHPDDRAVILAAAQRAIAERRPYEVEHRIRLPDGAERWVHEWATIVFDAAGRVQRLIGTTQDVTDRRRAEAALREREDLLRVIVDAAPLLISYVDVELRYRLVNLTYEEWFRTPRAEIHGRQVREVLGDEAWEVVRPWMERALRGEQVRYEREIPYRDGGPRWVQVTYIPHRDVQGEVQGFVTLVMDLSESKRGEAERTRLLEEARSANRAKDEFLAMLGHELRNPLAPIITALQVMKLRSDVFAPERELIERQARHLVQLVDDLLDVSRIARGKLELKRERVELSSVVGRAVEIASPAFEQQRHRLEVDVPTAGLLVDGDPMRLAQVFSNLLTNAAKFTPPGGRVWVEARREADEVVVAVRDEGVGIEPELLPRVFDLFVQGRQTTDRARGGLGLGLALVKNLVALHGGQVSARSEGSGHGTELVVRLPLAVGAASTPPRAPDRADATPSRAARVLVVDDNPDAAETLADLLAMEGHQVEVANDGPRALEVLSRFHPHIAILDIGLPVMDGFELARRVRAALPEDPPTLIALTGYGQQQDRDRSSAAGFAAHFVKPIDPEVLLEVVASSTREYEAG